MKLVIEAIGPADVKVMTEDGRVIENVVDVTINEVGLYDSWVTASVEFEFNMTRLGHQPRPLVEKVKAHKFNLIASSAYDLNGFGRVYCVESPVEAERSHDGLRSAFGDLVNIDGSDYQIIAFETYAIATHVEVGEKIGILVKPVKQ